MLVGVAAAVRECWRLSGKILVQLLSLISQFPDMTLVSRDGRLDIAQYALKYRHLCFLCCKIFFSVGDSTFKTQVVSNGWNYVCFHVWGREEVFASLRIEKVSSGRGCSDSVNLRLMASSEH